MTKHRFDKANIRATEAERLPAGFWMPPADLDYQSEFEEFQRQFALRPELAEASGLRSFLREDTLTSTN